MSKFDHLANTVVGTGTFSWDSDRTLLYAVGVGAGLADPLDELQFTTENTQGVKQQVIPSFMSHMAVAGGTWLKELGFPPRPWDGYPEGLVQGEQSFTLHRSIPPAGRAELEQVLIGIFDKGSGAHIVSETRATLADTGEPLGSSRTGLFVRGQGGFGGPRGPADALPWIRQEREPDFTVSLALPIFQSLIFRLSGDRNAHATDPATAKADGFDRPIFFGLGTYGFACRALLKGLCDNDVERFGAMEARFSQPVIPGDRLDTQIWRTEGGAQFQTLANGERLVIDRGIFRYR